MLGSSAIEDSSRLDFYERMLQSHQEEVQNAKLDNCCDYRLGMGDNCCDYRLEMGTSRVPCIVYWFLRDASKQKIKGKCCPEAGRSG